MEKNYPLPFLWAPMLTLLSVSILLGPVVLSAQEIKIFTLKDFDLHGEVKSCLVVTDYGKEEYDFAPNGFLTKSVTRYNDTDYDISSFKYQNGQLLENRVENYRNGTLDKTTSLVHIYTMDTTALKRISETVFSYNKEFLGRYEYEYDSINRLVKIRQVDNEGIDESDIEYTTFKGETTKTYSLNGVIQKSIRISIKKGKNNTENRVELTKKFLGGDAINATEKVYNADNRILSEETFIFDAETKKFVSQQILLYHYDDLGILTELRIKTPNTESVKNYIYQFDDGATGNWIKKIVTPDNSYITRKIQYYAPVVIEDKQ
ncbi:hypothetical protein K8352_14430 [Flavobacteriaceae bacterium F89]|uniref:YD repeat-containing protein n=1 Tax=Cerina litoralis TaxID=2874477 RepID=A0AAE3JS13_9FLAO|nr:hypothetical protein [Cerina litoralis]MCG2461953.1 hypothetical protein [Cerina litoralis]